MNVILLRKKNLNNMVAYIQANQETETVFPQPSPSDGLRELQGLLFGVIEKRATHTLKTRYTVAISSS